MRIFHISADGFVELDRLPDVMPQGGYVWVGTSRTEFETKVSELQACLQRWTGGQLVDLHVADLLNQQLPSHFDYTSWYDLMVFRRLAPGANSSDLFVDAENGTVASARAAFAAIDTSPVGFAVFDRVLVTVHPADCMV
ncbi:MAG: corA, partial [Rhizobacter sp.]|nr:corA [Rhizobacter sp.]